MATSVVAFAGHMIDAPGRTVPRFPERLVPAVEAALAAFFAGLQDAVVFASAANGADLLFVDAAWRHGAEIRLVLPFEPEAFVASSVLPGGAGWLTRFEEAMRRAASVEVLGEVGDGDRRGADTLFEAAAMRVESLAAARAAELQVRPLLLCVLDPDAPGAVGGTLGSHARWQDAGGETRVIDLRALRESRALPRSREPTSGPAPG